MLNQVFILWSFALWAWQLFFFMTFHAHTHTPTYVHTLEFFVKHIFSWHMHFYLQKYQVTAGFLLSYALYAFTILKISRSETRNSTFQSNFCFTLIPVFVADRNFDQYTARFLLVHTILSLSLSLSDAFSSTHCIASFVFEAWSATDADLASFLLLPPYI